MTGYYYLDISLKFKEDTDIVLTPVYFKGSVENSLRSIFGQIGGQTELELIKFDRDGRRAVIRIPENYYVKTRVAITLIGRFQDIPCHFEVKSASPVLANSF